MPPITEAAAHGTSGGRCFGRADLEETAGAVLDGLYGNAAFPNPPVLKPALQAALTAFTSAIAAQAQGGTAATAEKNNLRDALISLLRVLAAYVPGAANNDLAKLLSSGFEAVSTNRAQRRSTRRPSPTSRTG